MQSVIGKLSHSAARTRRMNPCRGVCSGAARQSMISKGKINLINTPKRSISNNATAPLATPSQRNLLSTYSQNTFAHGATLHSTRAFANKTCQSFGFRKQQDTQKMIISRSHSFSKSRPTKKALRTSTTPILGCFLPGFNAPSSPRGFATANTLELIKQLRKQTMAGYMDCKKALEKNDFDLDKSIDWLSEQGLLKTQDESFLKRVAAEGLVSVMLSPDRRLGAITEMNCETDFVSRGETFSHLAFAATRVASQLGQQRLGALPSSSSGDPLSHTLDLSVDELMTQPVHDDGHNFQEFIAAAVLKIREKMTLRRATVVGGRGLVGAYIHGEQAFEHEHKGYFGTGRIGAVVVVGAERPEALEAPALGEVATQLARHVTGFTPKCVRRDNLKEDDLLAYQKKWEDKAKKAFDERKFKPAMAYSDLVLYDQEMSLFAPYSNKTVQQMLVAEGKKLNSELWVESFIRWEKGEGIEQKVDSFAEEVRKQAGL